MDRKRLIYKIAKAYYEKGLTQQEIADRYGVSRIKVSRLLSSALKEKMVQITIVPPEDEFVDLENILEDKFNLDEVIIVHISENEKENDLLDKLGKAGANYLMMTLQGNETIGLTWGRTLLKLVDNLPLTNFPELKVVQMLGGLGEPESEYHGADLTRRMAQCFGTRPRLIHSPGIVKSSVICRELKDDLQIKDTLKLASHTDIAIVGIGLFSERSSLFSGDTILNGEDKRILMQKGAVGDISLRFFNKRGEFLKTELDERIIGLSCDELKQIPRIIGVAGGEDKFETIYATLKGQLISVLITDNNTAQKLAIN